MIIITYCAYARLGKTLKIWFDSFLFEQTFRVTSWRYQVRSSCWHVVSRLYLCRAFARENSFTRKSWGLLVYTYSFSSRYILAKYHSMYQWKYYLFLEPAITCTLQTFTARSLELICNQLIMLIWWSCEIFYVNNFFLPLIHIMLLVKRHHLEIFSAHASLLIIMKFQSLPHTVSCDVIYTDESLLTDPWQY